MKLATFLIGVVLFGGILIGGATYYGGIQDIYSPSNSTSSADFDKFNETWTDYSGKLGQSLNKTVGLGEKGITDPSLWAGAFGVAIDVASTIAKTPNMAMTFVNFGFSILPFPVPQWAQILIFLMILITIAVIVIRIVLGRETL